MYSSEKNLFSLFLVKLMKPVLFYFVSLFHFSICSFSKVRILKSKIKRKKNKILTSQCYCTASLPFFQPVGEVCFQILVTFLFWQSSIKVFTCHQNQSSTSSVSHFWHWPKMGVYQRLTKSSIRILSQSTFMAS